MRTWVDASTLIALDAVGEVAVLRDLLGHVAITKPVAEEVLNGRESRILREARATWIEVVEVKGDLKRWMALGLGTGEASLFLTPQDDRLVFDEPPARTVAESEGRVYVGLLGLLVAGVRTQSLPAARARDIVQRLSRSGFHIASHLYEAVMQDLREQE